MMNPDKLQSLLTMHRKDIYGFIRFLGAGPEDADDLVQETFIAAFASRSQPKTENPSEWGRWLRGIARNMFLRFCRKHKTGFTLADPEELEKDLEFWNSEFSDESASSLHVEALRECMKKLSERDKKVVYMKYRDSNSRKQIADDTGLTEDGVKSLLRSIRSKLGQCIRSRLSGDTG
jgi:RNA polymerase sigma-70 factor (ECF subfamily)